MTKLLTRAELRDSVRRRLDQIPPIDQGIGNAGDTPFNAPWPTNAQINDALQEALAYINVEAGFHASDVAIPVAAASANTLGPASYPLGPLAGSAGSVNEVRRAVWDDGVNPVTILTMTGVGELDRTQSDYLQAPPATPTAFWIQGYAVYLSPAPATAGTLRLWCGTSVYGLQTDTDVIDQFAADLQMGVADFAVLKLLGLSGGNPMKASYFAGEVAAWTGLIKRWAATIAGEYQPGVGFRSYRGGLGTRRLRR